jgi:isoleucyl-tRNA synthetase
MSRRANWKAWSAPTRSRASASGYDFDVPLIDGDHVTDDAGTGFVHTAPAMAARTSTSGWTAPAIWKRAASTPPSPSPSVPMATSRQGCAGLRGRRQARVITDKGDKGNANEAVIKALIEADMLFARGRLKHTYPHSWRSKKPVIFRNTPQWFVYMDKDPSATGTTVLRLNDDITCA